MDIFGIHIGRLKKGLALPPSDADPGKRSKNEGELQSFGLTQTLTPPNPQLWTFVEQAALYNADFSGAIHTIKTLADTAFEILNSDGEALSDKAQEIVDDFTERCFPLGSGLRGYQIALIRSYAKYGALSTEAEILPDRSGIKQLWGVPVPEIQFKYIDGEYRPYQKVSGGAISNLIELNSITYQYTCGELWKDGAPYAKPPLSGAADAILRGEKILDNIDFVIEKGMMGVRDISFDQLPPPPGYTEGSPEHIAINKLMQDKIIASEKKYEREGFRVHHSGIKYDITQVVRDTRGLKDIHQSNEELVSTGTGISEALLGRSRTTTEAFANVMYLLATNNAETAQSLVASHLSYFINLELALKGVNEQVKIVHEPIPSLDPEAEAKAEEIRINNTLAKLYAGIIDLETAASELGYKTLPEATQTPPAVETPEKDTDSAESKRKLTSTRLSMPDGEADNLFNSFKGAIGGAAVKAQKTALARISIFLEDKVAGDFANGEDFARQLMSQLDNTFMQYAPDFSKAVEKTAPAFYEYLVLKDASAWGGAAAPVEFTFGQGAQTVVDFANRFEPHLCTTLWRDGKPATDSLSQYLSREYLEKGNDIFRRHSKAGFDNFRKAFTGKLDHLTDMQIRGIEDTFVMRMRNSAMLEQFHQAGVPQARITLTPNCCIVCEPFQGQLVDVENQYNGMMRQMEMSPDQYLGHLKENNSLIRSAARQNDEPYEDWQNRTEKVWNEMAGAQVQLPPYHTRCEHDITTA